MKKQDGITMVVLVFAVIIIFILTAVTFTFVVGDRGGLVVASEEAFRFDMQQIKEKVEEKQLEFELNNEQSSYAFTKNMEAQILEDYAGRIRILYEFSQEEKKYNLNVYYKPEQFTDVQKGIMRELGFKQDAIVVPSEEPSESDKPIDNSSTASPINGTGNTAVNTTTGS